MVNYAVTDYSTGRKNNPKLALDAMVTKLQTIVDTKNIRFSKVIRVGCMYEGLVIYDS